MDKELARKVQEAIDGIGDLARVFLTVCAPLYPLVVEILAVTAQERERAQTEEDPEPRQKYPDRIRAATLTNLKRERDEYRDAVTDLEEDFRKLQYSLKDVVAERDAARGTMDLALSRANRLAENAKVQFKEGEEAQDRFRREIERLTSDRDDLRALLAESDRLLNLRVGAMETEEDIMHDIVAIIVVDERVIYIKHADGSRSLLCMVAYKAWRGVLVQALLTHYGLEDKVITEDTNERPVGIAAEHPEPLTPGPAGSPVQGCTVPGCARLWRWTAGETGWKHEPE